MRIERPRSPHMVTVVIKGRGEVLRPVVGYAQKMALDLLDRLGRTEQPPKGTITATGVLREHVVRDMIPLGWVNAKRISDGVMDYYITKAGRFAREHGIVQDPPKHVAKAKRNGASKAPSLMAAQRARVARRAAAGKTRERRVA